MTCRVLGTLCKGNYAAYVKKNMPCLDLGVSWIGHIVIE